MWTVAVVLFVCTLIGSTTSADCQCSDCTFCESDLCVKLVDPWSDHYISATDTDEAVLVRSSDGSHWNCSCTGTDPNTGCDGLRGSWDCGAFSDDVIIVPSDTEDVGTEMGNPETNVCLTDEVVQEGELRIVNGDQVSTGRLEIYHDDEWGTICDDYGRTCDNFGDVACAQLGFQTCTIVHSYTAGGGSGTAEQMAYHVPIEPPSQIWMDEVSCDSTTDETLSDCSRLDWGSHNCAHGEDIAIECANPFGTPSPTAQPTDTCPAAGMYGVNWHQFVWSPSIVDSSCAQLSDLRITLHPHSIPFALHCPAQQGPVHRRPAA